jgi:hypothetical protein
MTDFFNIEFLKKRCIRTLVNRQEKTGNKTGILYSEGCYAWEIVNQSLSSDIDLIIKGQTIRLQPAFDQYLSLGIVPANYKYHRLILPGEPYLVRSDEVRYNWLKANPAEWDLLIIRHMVVPFQEANENPYPVYKTL